MVEFCRFGQVLLVFLLELVTKLSRLVLSFGPKMSLNTCKLFLMNFFQKIVLILLIIEIDHPNYLILHHFSTEVISYLFLMVKNHLYILNGGILFGFCNGITLKGFLFHLLSLTGFCGNYR